MLWLSENFKNNNLAKHASRTQLYLRVSKYIHFKIKYIGIVFVYKYIDHAAKTSRPRLHPKSNELPADDIPAKHKI